jgi:uncharacterized protein (TIGR01777 family)
MKVLLTGGSGLIGSHLSPFLEQQGYEVYNLVRNKNRTDNSHYLWAPENGILEKRSVENFQVVIHLAGENISSGRWSKNQKNKILSSRINSTRLLTDKIREIGNPPDVFICASAIGYYGDRGTEVLTENSEPGEGFLADVVKKWEQIASSIHYLGHRTVFLRTGVVLSKRGGALKKTLLPFKLGLGAILGSGQQYVSWISLSDLIHIINYIIQNKTISGAINAVSPQPITNRQYSKALGKALARPVILKTPSILLKIVLGEMANALLLSSSRVLPEKLTNSGYQFIHPTIDQAFEAIFKEDR